MSFVYSPLSKASYILPVKEWIAVLRDFFSLNPFCAFIKILYLFKNIVNLLYLNFSNLLEKTYETDVGI